MESARDTVALIRNEAGSIQVSEIRLLRQIGLLSATYLVVGSMIGAGIFISPKGVLEYTGSAGASLLVWTACSVLVFLGGLCYAELGTSVQVSGGEYSYFLLAFKTMGSFGTLPAFLFVYVTSFIINPACISIALLLFAEYVVEPFFATCAAPMPAKKLVAILAILLLTLLNCYSVPYSTKLNNILSVVKLITMGIVIFVGLYRYIRGYHDHIDMGFKGTTTSFRDFAKSFYFTFYAFEGWNNLNYVTEELINPSVNLPKSMFIGVSLVAVSYLLMNFFYFAVMTDIQILTSDAVAVGFANKCLGPIAFLVPILVAASSCGSANANILVDARLPFVAARNGLFPEVMSYVQMDYLTPTPSLIFNGVIVSCMLAAGNIDSLIDLFGFVSWTSYGFTFVSLLVLRYREKNLPRPFKVWTIVPIFMIGLALFLVVTPIIEKPTMKYMHVLLFLFSGLLLYIPFVYYKKKLKFMKKLAHVTQLTFKSASIRYKT